MSLRSTILLFAGELFLANSSYAVDIDFESVLKSYRQKNSFESSAKEIESQKRESLSAETRRFADAPNISLRSEIAEKDSSDQKYEFLVKQKINLGIDKDLARKKNESEFQFEKLTRMKEFLENETELAKLFSEIKYTQSILQNSRKILEIVGPYQGKAAAASNSGGLNGFFLARFQMFFENVKSDEKIFAERFSDLSTVFRGATDIQVSTDPSQNSFKPLNVRFTEVNIKEENNLPLQQSLAREQSLASDMAKLNNQRQIEVGLGVSMEKETQKNSYLVELGIPLGVSFANASEVSALSRAKSVASSEVSLKKTSTKQQASILKSNQTFAFKNYLAAVRKVELLESLFDKAQKAFKQGNTELGEYLETLRELHETRNKRAELLKTYEESCYALYYFAPGDI